MRLRGLAALALAGALAPATVPAGATPRGPGRADPAGRALVTGPARSVPVLRDGPFGTPARRLLGDAGGSLLARHVSSRGGWAWRSAIQGGRLQTDRDVGAAGVIVGLLALREVTGDPAYLTATRGTHCRMVMGEHPRRITESVQIPARRLCNLWEGEG